MYVNKTKFEENSSQQYYHMTCIGEKKHTSKRVLLGSNFRMPIRTYTNFPSLWFYSQYFEPPGDVTAAMLMVKLSRTKAFSSRNDYIV